MSARPSVGRCSKRWVSRRHAQIDVLARTGKVGARLAAGRATKHAVALSVAAKFGLERRLRETETRVDQADELAQLEPRAQLHERYAELARDDAAEVGRMRTESRGERGARRAGLGHDLLGSATTDRR